MSFIDNDDQDQGVNDNLVTLKRSQIKQLEDKAAKADQLSLVARENAFLKAGVDFDSPVGQLFAKGYDGDLDPTKIKEAAAAIPGVLKGGATAPAATSTGDEAQTAAAAAVSEEERQATAERAALAAGATAVPNAAQELDPREKALKESQQALRKGASEADALGHYFASVAEAAHKGDSRAISK